jgi:exodeoxyribonuclease VII large subunit
MPEQINGRNIFSLYEVTRSIQKTIADRYKRAYWIKAEMNKLNYYRQSGHCYPELVEKRNGKVIAQIQSNLWKDDYIKINGTFQRVLNEPLRDGIKILFLATISFHPEHGLNLRILDIDPSFTLGDLQREKQDTINRLISEGIYERNAIISVHTSKGYADFLKVIEAADKVYDYKFFHLLFPSLLQGDKAVESIQYQLQHIRRTLRHFDVVAIIRGGGGDIGLSCYNNYHLAKEIALFPIPVITGIGHATNETVVEMIAYENAITPTKLAEFLIQKFHDFAIPVQKARDKIVERSRKLITEEKSKFQSETKLFRSVTRNILLNHGSTLNEAIQSLSQQSRFIFRSESSALKDIRLKMAKDSLVFLQSTRRSLLQLGHAAKNQTVSQLKHNAFIVIQKTKQISTASGVIFRTHHAQLSNLEKNVNNMSPDNVLKRGFSITLFNGKAITTSETLQQGDTIKTILHNGSLESTVNFTPKQDE